MLKGNNMLKRRILAVITITALCLSCVIYPYAQDTGAYASGDTSVSTKDVGAVGPGGGYAGGGMIPPGGGVVPPMSGGGSGGGGSG